MTDAIAILPSAHLDARVENAEARRRVVPPVPQPPTKPLPLWRLLLQLRRNAIGTWGALAYEGEVLKAPFLGRTSVMVNAPEGIRQVLVDNAANYGRTAATRRILEPMIGDGLFLAEGADWRHQRRLVAPAFAPRSLEVVAKHVSRVTGGFVEDLAARAPAPFDALRVMQRLTLEVAGQALFSQAMRDWAPAIRGAIEAYGKTARPSFLDFLLPADAPDPVAWRRQRAGKGFKQVLDRIIAERAGQPTSEAKPRDLFDVLSTATSPDTGEPFGTTALRDQIATLIIAGHETTALSLFWSIYLLALAPEWQEQIAEEAGALDLSPEGAHAAAERLPVTRAVIHEALRLYPPAYSIVRQALGRDTILGHEVPAGALVVIAPWILHRHRQRWHDPDAFDPRRFLPGAPPVDRYAYLPFGIGPRTCVGAQFALLEATLVLATLVRRFRIELPGSKRIMPVAIVTTAPERAAAFRLRPR